MVRKFTITKRWRHKPGGILVSKLKLRDPRIIRDQTSNFVSKFDLDRFDGRRERTRREVKGKRRRARNTFF